MLFSRHSELTNLLLCCIGGGRLGIWWSVLLLLRAAHISWRLSRHRALKGWSLVLHLPMSLPQIGH